MPIRELSVRFPGVPEVRGQLRSPRLEPYRRSILPADAAKPFAVPISMGPWPCRLVSLPSWFDTKEKTAWVFGA